MIFALALWWVGSMAAQGPGPLQSDGTAGVATRFTILDVVIDTGAERLAAYQVETWSTEDGARIVGVEGGQAGPFHNAPYFDPVAIQRDRVILGAYSLEKADLLPGGLVRVATIHCQVRASTPHFAVRLAAAANAEGKSIRAQVHLTERKAP